MKKIIAMLVVASMLLAGVIAAVPANAVDTVLYTVESALVNDGTQLDVTIKMENNTQGLYAAMLFLDYNEEVLTYVDGSAANGDVWSKESASIDVSFMGADATYDWGKNVIYLNFSGNDVVNATNVVAGTLATVSFTVKEGVVIDETFDKAELGLALKTWGTGAEWTHEETNHVYIDENYEGAAVPFEVVVADIDMPLPADVLVPVEIENDGNLAALELTFNAVGTDKWAFAGFDGIDAADYEVAVNEEDGSYVVTFKNLDAVNKLLADGKTLNAVYVATVPSAKADDISDDAKTVENTIETQAPVVEDETTKAPVDEDETTAAPAPETTAPAKPVVPTGDNMMYVAIIAVLALAACSTVVVYRKRSAK